ncbi:GDSL esterase/lipase At4g10955-like isoform X1 [Impatiens glandulifera]|uniref:GDSL esterase/lipase At4g10955-like isoform X1 n=1 Tax=Impatiens glandulifera TaxID=253017 RepID=UPI001FB08B51|nr:GDSL esterase/lipase At4g10955-like isoform X1 [Impatiens glandulifera]
MENRIEEEEEGNQLTMAAAAKGDKSVDDHHHHHPYAFHVSGPRNLSSPNWTDLIISTWKDENYKRMVMACFIQSVYLLELDRQEKRTKENSLAPKWWIPFKYKLTETLIDERDGSIFGAVLEWDGFIFMRPSGAPKAVLALRGTILKSSTIRRDVEDDLRFLAWETLKGSVRFTAALNALKSITHKYGSNNICIAGHSLGAGFALQVGKTLAHQGVYVEAHLFNPPSVSLSMSMKNIGEKAIFAYNRFKSILPFNAIIGEQTNVVTNITPPSSSSSNGLKKYWIPHLYVNNNDYICCYYTDQPKTTPIKTENKGTAKLFVLSKGKQKFLEAHKLEQWWSDDLELQLALQTSTLISKQLQSLYI